MNENGRLAGKVAIVTGGAQGLGFAVAEKLSSEGAISIIADLNCENGNHAAQKITDRGMKAYFRETDVSSKGEIEKLIDSTISECGALDTVVNSAAPLRKPVGSIEECLDNWDINISVLLKGPYMVSLFASEKMPPGGSIVNISSMVAFAVTHQPAGYHIAKAGLEHLTRYLAVDLAKRGIRVNGVCPALVDMADRKPLTADPINKVVVESTVPLRRAANPEDIANAVAFLCSEDSSYITGHCLVVDGGLLAMEPFHAARLAYNIAKPVNAIQ